MDTGVAVASRSRGRFVLGWVLSAIPSALMVMGGIMSVMNSEQTRQGMAKYGYPESAIVPIGLSALAAVVLFLIPRTSFFGAILMTAYLGGAVSTHVRAGEPFWLPMMVCVFAWVGLTLRDARVEAAVTRR